MVKTPISSMTVPPPLQPYFDHQGQQFGFTGTEEPVQKPQEHSLTLLVRHLPEAIPQDTLSRLFSHYGASSIRPCVGGRLRNCAFVDFKDEVLASQAQSQLHRLKFLGKVLSVERAGRTMSNNKNQQSEGGKNSTCAPETGAPATSILAKGGIPSLLPINEPVASKLGVDYPFPPHLDVCPSALDAIFWSFEPSALLNCSSIELYAYPPPDGNILTNIVNALIAVPRFYTQVLHLMNKMNIPAPFRMALPTPPLPPPVQAPPPPPPSPPPVPHLLDQSSDESELESSDEGDADDQSYTRGVPHPRKCAKRESIVGPAVDKGVAHEAVGLKPAALVPKEIPFIKRKHPVLQIKIAPKPIREVTDDERNMKDLIELACEGPDVKPCATAQDIEAGKLPPEEILSLPMFKNYSAGNPSPVLYIKNLAKDVVDDFYFIFGSLFDSAESARGGLNVKLMQEGRMRGQAFLTFPSIDLAHNALNLVNGYVFKGKPMIIQFGRNPVGVSKAS